MAPVMGAIMALTVRKGDEGAYGELIAAVGRNCTCEVADVEQMKPPLCPAHKMISEQKGLDRLMFARTVRDKIKHEEHGRQKRRGP